MKKFALTSAVAAAVAGIVAGFLAFGPGASAAEDRRPVAAVAEAAPLDLAEAALTDTPGVTYVQNGETVTASQDGAVVATLTLLSADYTEDGGAVVIAVDATRPVVIDPQMFVVYGSTGGENAPAETTPQTVGNGRQEIRLNYTETVGRPEALGWAPANGDAVWAR